MPTFNKEELEVMSDISRIQGYLDNKIEYIQDTNKAILRLEAEIRDTKVYLTRYQEEAQAYETKLLGLRRKLNELLGIANLQPYLPTPPGQCHIGDGSLASLEKRTNDQG